MKKLLKKNKKYVILGIVAIVFLVWGLVGGSQADKIGVTCDMGINDGHAFCWKWHKNVVGEMQDAVNGFFEGFDR